jgi:hypothetical protein
MKVCPQCGAQNDGNAAFCANCGAGVADVRQDGAPPPYQPGPPRQSYQAGPPPQPAYAQEPYGQQPYGQPPQGYPAQPVGPLSANPVLNLLKTAGSGTLFLTASILVTASLLFQLLATTTMVSYPMVEMLEGMLEGMLPYSMVEMAPYNLLRMAQGASIAGVLMGMAPSILICIALWLVYTSAKNSAVPGVNPTAFTIIRVITIIQMAFFLLAMFVAVIAVVIGAVVAANVPFGSSAAGGAVVVLLVFLIVLLLGVAVFIFFYYRSILNTLKALQTINATADPSSAVKISQFLIVMNYIGGGLGCLAALLSLATNFWTFLAGGAGAVFTILMAVALSKLKQQLIRMEYSRG